MCTAQGEGPSSKVTSFISAPTPEDTVHLLALADLGQYNEDGSRNFAYWYQYYEPADEFYAIDTMQYTVGPLPEGGRGGEECLGWVRPTGRPPLRNALVMQPLTSHRSSCAPAARRPHSPSPTPASGDAHDPGGGQQRGGAGRHSGDIPCPARGGPDREVPLRLAQR